MLAKNSPPTTSGHSKSFSRFVKKQMLSVPIYLLGNLMLEKTPKPSEARRIAAPRARALTKR
jgi:hypothetical protein